MRGAQCSSKDIGHGWLTTFDCFYWREAGVCGFGAATWRDENKPCRVSGERAIVHAGVAEPRETVLPHLLRGDIGRWRVVRGGFAEASRYGAVVDVVGSAKAANIRISNEDSVGPLFSTRSTHVSPDENMTILVAAVESHWQRVPRRAARRTGRKRQQQFCRRVSGERAVVHAGVAEPRQAVLPHLVRGDIGRWRVVRGGFASRYGAVADVVGSAKAACSGWVYE
ncbi:hypothetical protein B0H17DRAFT_1131202 [Mycena rosella]|uniref:Uncharacterized protein n=1 Tax=Mycena rosella TaxID=1033263 RepID=A0AAD7DNK5_MYCRO|nr:hypothetical protein B0H17DRAFT_1131202 [Mycena rosella]